VPQVGQALREGSSTDSEDWWHQAMVAQQWPGVECLSEHIGWGIGARIAQLHAIATVGLEPAESWLNSLEWVRQCS
jgi:hypothetical protein